MWHNAWWRGVFPSCVALILMWQEGVSPLPIASFPFQHNREGHVPVLLFSYQHDEKGPALLITFFPFWCGTPPVLLFSYPVVPILFYFLFAYYVVMVNVVKYIIFFNHIISTCLWALPVLYTLICLNNLEWLIALRLRNSIVIMCQMMWQCHDNGLSKI